MKDEAAGYTLSIVIPVYNGSATIASLVDQLSQLLPSLASDYEVILVNDGSPDNSWQEISRLQAKFPHVHGIDLMRNYGQHNALLAGVRAAQYSVTVTMDDDLQHPPTEIPKLLASLAQGYDVVYGTPENEQ